MDQNTQTFTPPTAVNPLTKHFRQPAIYLKIPSLGNYWPEGSIDLPVTGEIPVLPMSTKDEITLKTPDALLNGQGVVNVIQSCCPNIKDAWQMPSLDVDATIIAIRIASYGPEMDFTAGCPHCESSNDYAIDLTVLLSSIHAPSYAQKLSVDELLIKLKPQPYFSVNKANIISFEEQQIIRSLGELENDPQKAQELFNRQLDKIIELNISILTDSTESIETNDGSSVKEPAFIQEFYKNCDSKIIKAVRARLEELSKSAGITPVKVNCKNEECTKEFDVTLTFDFASFFEKGS